MMNRNMSAKGGSASGGKKNSQLLFLILAVLISSFAFFSSPKITLATATCEELKGRCIDGSEEGGTNCKTGEKSQETDDCQYADIKECCVPGPATSPAKGGTTAPQVGGAVQLKNPLSDVGEGTAGVATVIGRIINLILGVVGSFALLMFVYGGFLMITSAGHSESVKKGKDTLTWSIIGIAVILGSYILAGYVISGFQGQIKPAGIPGGAAPGGVLSDDTKCDAWQGSCTDITCTGTNFSVCLKKYLTDNPGSVCQQNLCTGVATRVCCKPIQTPKSCSDPPTNGVCIRISCGKDLIACAKNLEPSLTCVTGLCLGYPADVLCCTSP